MTMLLSPTKSALLLLVSALVFALMYMFVVHAHDWSTTHIQSATSDKQNLLQQEERLALDERNSSNLKQRFSADRLAELLHHHSTDQLARRMEALATINHMSGFHYSLSEPIEPQEHRIGTTSRIMLARELTLDASAPHDASIYDFLISLGSSGGRYDIESLMIEKISSPPDRKPASENTKWSAKIIWFANGKKD